MPIYAYGGSREWIAKVDAWVLAIRNLSRDHKVAHHPSIGLAVKEARKVTASATWQPTHLIDKSYRLAVEAGIPPEDLLAVRALIFG